MDIDQERELTQIITIIKRDLEDKIAQLESRIVELERAVSALMRAHGHGDNEEEEN